MAPQYIIASVCYCQEDLNMIAMVGKSDRPGWLAEACQSFFIFFHMQLPPL